MRKGKLLFDDAISDTLLIPLWMRAIESQRSDRLFEDKEAEAIVKLLPINFEQFNSNIFARLGTAIRVSLLDNQARLALKNAKQPILVHLGCGLDNRFNRVDDGTGIHINIDLPEVIAWREKLNLYSSERNISMSGSILETDWMDELLAKYPNHSFYFFIEGVLVYFSQQQVKQLFLELAKRFKGGQICFDAYTGWLVNKYGAPQDINDQMRASYKWCYDNIKEPEEWSSDLIHLSTTHYLKLYPKRWGIYILIRLFPKLANCSLVSVFQIKP